MKILIRNLARSTTEKELRALFIQYGRVQSCDLVLDKATGKSKGFAFVEMPKVGEAKVAIKNLNNREVAGDKIRVKKAETKVEVENKAKSVDESLVENNESDAVVEKSEQVTQDEPSKKFSWTEKKII